MKNTTRSIAVFIALSLHAGPLALQAQAVTETVPAETKPIVEVLRPVPAPEKAEQPQDQPQDQEKAKEPVDETKKPEGETPDEPAPEAEAAE